MPVDIDVIKSRIADIEEAIRELDRLTSKPYEELSLDENTLLDTI